MAEIKLVNRIRLFGVIKRVLLILRVSRGRFTLTFIVALYCTTCQEFGLKNLKTSLTKPAAGTQPWAIWIWNLSISKQEIENQLSSIISKGFGGVAVRPGRDMRPVYMSQEFLENFGLVLEIARQNKIGVRLADDFSLLWGGCADSITRYGRKLQAEYLALVREISPATDSPDAEIQIDPNGEYMAQAIKRAPKTGEITDVKQISVPEGKTAFKWKAPNADWSLLLYKKELARDPSGAIVPGIYNLKASQLYIQNTLDVFRTTFSRYIPTTFEGFVTEMPTLRPGGNAIFWDDDLVVKYRTKYKRDLLTLLPSVFLETPGAEKTRIQVHHFIYHLLAERFSALLETWAKKYRLTQWLLWPETGFYRPEHALADGFILPESPVASFGFQNVDGGRHNFALLRMAADINTNWRRRETITVVGRNRTMVGSSLQDLKREIDLSLLAGNSRILIDGLYFNVDRRNYYKTPFNPSWYSPEWEHAKELCEYSARMQDIISGLHASREIAVLSPTDAIIGEYLPGKSSVAAVGLTRFRKTVDMLCSLGKEFDVVSEELLLTCMVRQSGEFATADRIRKGNYHALIVPYAPCVSRSLLVFLEKLAVKGTIIVFIDEAPNGTHEDGATPNVTMRIQKLVAPRRENVSVASPLELEQILIGLKPEVTLLREAGETTDVAAQVYHADGGGKVHILHNISDSADQAVIAEFLTDKYYAAVDCMSGKITELEPVEAEKNTVRMRICLSPLQTLLIVSGAARIPSSPGQDGDEFNPFALPARMYRIVFKDQWALEPLNLNALPLANWSVRIGTSKGSGQIAHFYETTFEVKHLPDHCAFVLDGMSRADALFQGCEVTLNGMRLDNDPASFEDDPAVSETPLIKVLGEKSHCFDIRKKLVKGLNRVSIRTTGSALDPQTLIYPPLITGSFTVSKGPHGMVVDQPAEDALAGHESWAKHGYPYLSGRARYTQTFEVPHDYDRLILRFSKVSGAISVKVNGEDIGTLNWQPMEADITGYCKALRNEISVETVNTLDNALRLNGHPSGLTGEIYVDVYKAQ